MSPKKTDFNSWRPVIARAAQRMGYTGNADIAKAIRAYAQAHPDARHPLPEKNLSPLISAYVLKNSKPRDAFYVSYPPEGFEIGDLKTIPYYLMQVLDLNPLDAFPGDPILNTEEEIEERAENEGPMLYEWPGLARPSIEEERSSIEDRYAFYGALSTVFSTLTPREERIVRLRYLFEQSQDDVAHALGLTRTRIGQIENLAHRKLRHPSRKLSLKDWLGNKTYDELRMGRAGDIEESLSRHWQELEARLGRETASALWVRYQAYHDEYEETGPSLSPSS